MEDCESVCLEQVYDSFILNETRRHVFCAFIFLFDLCQYLLKIINSLIDKRFKSDCILQVLVVDIKLTWKKSVNWFEGFLKVQWLSFSMPIISAGNCWNLYIKYLGTFFLRWEVLQTKHGKIKVNRYVWETP